MQADVARYYTVSVVYFSGRRDPDMLSTDTTSQLDTVDISCSTDAAGALGYAGRSLAADTWLVVDCPTGCGGTSGQVYAASAGVYLATSSVCRAAIHAGKITGIEGGPVMLLLSAGSSTPRDLTCEYGCINHWWCTVLPACAFAGSRSWSACSCSSLQCCNRYQCTSPSMQVAWDAAGQTGLNCCNPTSVCRHHGGQRRDAHLPHRLQHSRHQL